MNAFTMEDMTAYFISVPANKLELWMWMESERIRHPVFREFYAERDVVFEERRMRTDSTPLGKFSEEGEAMFWESVPYHWPVIGWPSDIEAISKPQADEFYALYYTPQNITLILVGDFKSEDAEKLAKKYFERIPRGKKNPPDVVTVEVPQVAAKRMYAEAETNPTADLNWHTVPFGHKDSYAVAACWRNCSPRGRAGFTREWCWVQASRRKFTRSSNRTNGRALSPPAATRPTARRRKTSRKACWRNWKN